MRGQWEKSLAKVPQDALQGREVRVVDGGFDDFSKTGVKKGEVDLVVIAQAWHWCPDHEKAFVSATRLPRQIHTLTLSHAHIHIHAPSGNYNHNRHDDPSASHNISLENMTAGSVGEQGYFIWLCLYVAARNRLLPLPNRHPRLRMEPRILERQTPAGPPCAVRAARPRFAAVLQDAVAQGI